jgi:hypothetical protein
LPDRLSVCAPAWREAAFCHNLNHGGNAAYQSARIINHGHCGPA